MQSKEPVITSIASGKGGVGKTFITANLAACLVREGRKVLVVDCDLGLANMDILLGITPMFTLQDVVFGDQTIQDVITSTNAGFDLLPASSGVKEMGQLLYEKIQMIKSALSSIFPNYDEVLLDTGAGISEVVLQFSLFAPRNIIVLNREPTSLTDAYAVIKVMHQRFDRTSFGIIVNSARDEKEADRLFGHIDTVCRDFLGISLHYLGHIVSDEAIPGSIVNQKVLVQTHPNSRVGINCFNIARAASNWKPQAMATEGPSAK
ncbi:MAG: MinD/ParA family protein [Desulfobacterales bacterium]|nr:MinD/ParA family protein [Desulfobacterales bacterium]